MPKLTVAGQSYEVVATYGLLRRIRDVHGYDMLHTEMSGLAKFLSDQDAAFIINCEFLGLTTTEQQEEHANACRGADIAAMSAAVTESLKDFFRERGEPERVAAIEKMVAMVQESRKALATKISDSDMQSEVTKEILSLDFQEEYRKAMAGNKSQKLPVA